MYKKVLLLLAAAMFGYILGRYQTFDINHDGRISIGDARILITDIKESYDNAR